MRIAFVTPQAQLVSGDTFASGPANYLLRVSLALRDLGHEPLVVAMGDADGVDDAGAFTLHTVSGRYPTRFDRLRARTLHAHAFFSRRLNARLRTIHRATPIDVVQYTNYRGAALFRPPELPAVIRASSFRDLWDATHHTRGDTRARRRAARIERRAFDRVDAVYAPSRLLAGTIEREIGREVAVIEPPFFFETEERQPARARTMAEEGPFLLFVGALTERKGVHLLAEVAPRVFADHPGLRLALAGRNREFGTATMLDFVTERAGAARERVHYLGEVPHVELYPFYEEATVVMLPSLVDNLPNSCLEAMASGAVVVGTRGASFDQLIEDGVSGFLADAGDAASLEQAVRRALALDESGRAMVGAAARQRIAAMAPQRVVPEMVNLYERVIGGGR